MKLRIFIVMCAAIFVFGTVGQAADKAPIDIDKAISNIETTKQFAESADDYSDRNEVKAMLLYSIHLLRGPNPDGATYKYATVKKDIVSEQMLSETVNADYGKNEKQTISIDSSTVTGFQIRSPLHRGFFKNNGNIYVYSYKIEYSVNGEKKVDEKPFGQWITRDTTIDVDVPGIAEWAKLDVVIATDAADLDTAVLHLYVQYPQIVDDPMNPFLYSLDQLKDALARVTDGRRLKEVVRFQDTAREGIAKVPQAVGAQGPAPAAPKPDAPKITGKKIIEKLRYIQYLVEQRGDVELDEASSELTNLIEALE